MYLKLFCIVFLLHYTRSEVLDLTCSDIRTFVDGHNSRRLTLVTKGVDNQPPASDMKYMVWDNELAEKAKKWASFYTTEHDPDTSIDSGRFSIIQTTYKVHSKYQNAKLDIDDVLDKWFDQHTKYVFGPFGFDEDTNGNYVRMMRSQSKYIGCAISKNIDDMDGLKSYYIVCNYGPNFSPNYKDDEPYQAGPGDDKLQCDSDECHHPYGNFCSAYQH